MHYNTSMGTKRTQNDKLSNWYFFFQPQNQYDRKLISDEKNEGIIVFVDCLLCQWPNNILSSVFHRVHYEYFTYFKNKIYSVSI